MDLTTRCPECHTTFAASLEQLQLRKGYIRCINCAHIFDGFEAVVSPGSAEPAPEHRISSAVAGKGPAFSVPANRQPDESADASGPAFRLGSGQVSSRPEPSVSVPAGAVKVEPVVHHAGVSAGTSTSPAGSGQGAQVYAEPRLGTEAAKAGQAYHAYPETPARSGGVSRFLWRFLIMLGFVLLLAQLLYVYRAQIANNVPAVRPVLEQACASLNCTVPYSRQIEQISITSSSLRSGTGAAVGSAPEAPSGNATDANDAPLLLQVTMRNTYDKPQEWPVLVLDLTDLSGALIVRKNLPPETYLPPDVLGQPFRAASEITVNVPVTPQGVKANGYQLDKFFQ